MAAESASLIPLAAPSQYGAGQVLAVTKSDTVPLPPGVRGIWVGGTGDLYVRGIFNGAMVAILSVPAGTYLPIRAAYVGASTTATSVVAFLQ